MKLIGFGYEEFIREVTHTKAEGPEFVFRRRAASNTKKKREYCGTEVLWECWKVEF